MSGAGNALQTAGSPPSATKISIGRQFFWSVRRELWENRSIYIAPIAVGAFIVLGAMVGTFHSAASMHPASLDMAEQHKSIEEPYIFSAMLLMFTSMIIGVIYCLDALYGERRDRSILFWKSLPVSDIATVLAKASIPILVLPLVTFGVTVVVHSLMLLIGAVGSTGNGMSAWSQISFSQMWLMLLYHLIAGHGLWWAAYWAWLLLVSAWSKRAPFLWAVLPPLAIGLVEKIAFNSTHFANLLKSVFVGGPQSDTSSQTMSMKVLLPASPLVQLASPEFWIGLIVAAAFLFAAARLRRSQAPL